MNSSVECHFFEPAKESEKVQEIRAKYLLTVCQGSKSFFVFNNHERFVKKRASSYESKSLLSGTETSRTTFLCFIFCSVLLRADCLKFTYT